MKTLPWEFHPDLTEERLVRIAEFIVEGRQVAVELHNESEGDDGWTLGCRAFQFVRFRILRAVDEGLVWLRAIDRTMHLVFQIGQVPVRFYRGEPSEPTERTLNQTNDELKQLSLVFPDHDSARDLAYRFAIDTDVDGSALAIYFVGLRGKSAVLNWQVPVEIGGVISGGVGRPATEPVELDAPEIKVRRDDASEKEHDEK